jgi:hypothetical protein
MSYGAIRSQKSGFQTCNPTKGAPIIDGVAHDANIAPKLLCKPNTGTYENGFDRAGADYGAAVGEGKLYVGEVMDVHPASSTPYDKTTAYGAGAKIKLAECVKDEIYELRCGSSSWDYGRQIKVGANGLAVTMVLATNADVASKHKRVHYFTVAEEISSATLVLAKYEGIGYEQLAT